MNDPKPIVPGKPYISWGITAFGVLLIFFGIYHFGASLLEWLRDGAVGEPTIRQVLDGVGIRPTPVSWVGVQKIIDWYLALNAGSGLFGTGLFLTLLWGWIAETVEEDRRSAVREVAEWEHRNPSRKLETTK